MSDASANDEKCSECDGVGALWMNGCEIQRCDTCEQFANDDTAAENVTLTVEVKLSVMVSANGYLGRSGNVERELAELALGRLEAGGMTVEDIEGMLDEGVENPVVNVIAIVKES